MSEAKPYPKSAQLARGTRKYRRKVAGAKQWAAISAEKVGPCRSCLNHASNGRLHGKIQLHHVVPRSRGGDDVADNIIPLCPRCHDRVTRRDVPTATAMLARLTDAEYAYAIGKCGEGVFERVYGVKYGRS